MGQFQAQELQQNRSSKSILLFFLLSVIPAGSYVPFFSPRGPVRKPVEVATFQVDVHPVTQEEYLKFVKKNPEWRRSKVPKIYSDVSYLKNWKSDLELQRPTDRRRPITQVSWFAASAYCQAHGGDLPTTDQWEYVADDAGKNNDTTKKLILEWYSSPNPKSLESVMNRPPNSYGVYDLYGLVWEWTQDFNSLMSGTELRSDSSKDESLFCGAGALNSMDPSDYAKFMRYSFRSSLKANYTTANLGFRCAKEIVK